MRFLTKLILVVILSICTFETYAQVTFGSTIKPSPGALLDLKENSDDAANSNKGLLMPRVKLEDLNRLAPTVSDAQVTQHPEERSKHIGLVVYNVTENVLKELVQGMYVWDGEKWMPLFKMSNETLSIDGLGSLYTLDGNTHTLDVTSSSDWTTEILSDPDNILASVQQKGSGDESLTPTSLSFKLIKEVVSENSTIKKHAEVALKNKGKALTFKVTAEGLYIITPPKTQTKFYANADGYVHTNKYESNSTRRPTWIIWYKSNSSVMPIIENQPDWIEFAMLPDSINGYKRVELNVLANPTLYTRYREMTLKLAGVEANAKDIQIVVSQEVGGVIKQHFEYGYLDTYSYPAKHMSPPDNKDIRDIWSSVEIFNKYEGVGGSGKGIYTKNETVYVEVEYLTSSTGWITDLYGRQFREGQAYSFGRGGPSITLADNSSASARHARIIFTRYPIPGKGFHIDRSVGIIRQKGAGGDGGGEVSPPDPGPGPISQTIFRVYPIELGQYETRYITEGNTIKCFNVNTYTGISIGATKKGDEKDEGIWLYHDNGKVLGGGSSNPPSPAKLKVDIDVYSNGDRINVRQLKSQGAIPGTAYWFEFKNNVTGATRIMRIDMDDSCRW